MTFYWYRNVLGSYGSNYFTPIYTMYFELCTLHCNFQCTVHNIHCAVYNIQCAVYSIQCAVHNNHCAVYNIQCAVYSIQCAVQGIHCPVLVECTESVYDFTGPGFSPFLCRRILARTALLYTALHCTALQ